MAVRSILLSAADGLLAQEHDAMLEQRCLDLGEQMVSARGLPAVDAADHGADGGGHGTEMRATLLARLRR